MALKKINGEDVVASVVLNAAGEVVSTFGGGGDGGSAIASIYQSYAAVTVDEGSGVANTVIDAEANRVYLQFTNTSQNNTTIVYLSYDDDANSVYFAYRLAFGESVIIPEATVAGRWRASANPILGATVTMITGYSS